MKEDKTFIHRIELPSRLQKNLSTVLKEDKYTVTLRNQLVFQKAKEVSNFLLKEIYNVYAGKADEVYVLDETEFEYFINKYLPIYMAERNNYE